MTDETKRWFAIDVDAAPSAAEAIEFAFNTLDALGTEIDHLRKTGSDSVKITAYFNDLPSESIVNDEIANALNIYSLKKDCVRSVSYREVIDQDWLAEWKRHWKPTEIGKFVIAPPWSDVGGTEKIVIRIEPNMAFGTGTHDTTQLCLKAIDDRYRPELSLLDVGTGTGILAIAAAKRGGTNILACDTDADSVKIARENAAFNGVGDRITFFDGPIDEATPSFDLVCANLTIDVIVPILDLLLEKTKTFLLLSGILGEQEQIIRDELLKFEISDLKLESSGEWISVLIEK